MADKQAGMVDRMDDDVASAGRDRVAGQRGGKGRGDETRKDGECGQGGEAANQMTAGRHGSLLSLL